MNPGLPISGERVNSRRRLVIRKDQTEVSPMVKKLIRVLNDQSPIKVSDLSDKLGVSYAKIQMLLKTVPSDVTVYEGYGEVGLLSKYEI